MKPKNPVPDKKNEEAFNLVERAVDSLKKDRPIVIGITGAGGAGKTTFGINIMNYYGKENCISIDLDDYLISRDQRGKLGLTGYHPEANRLYLARKNIESLLRRQKIHKPKYNHSIGRILRDEELIPKELIIIEGVTTLYPELKELNDLSLFLDASEETQIKSRIQRDVKKRGYTLEEALTLFKRLKPFYKEFIEPTKKDASIVFEVDTDYVMHTIHISEELR